MGGLVPIADQNILRAQNVKKNNEKKKLKKNEDINLEKAKTKKKITRISRTTGNILEKNNDKSKKKLKKKYKRKYYTQKKTKNNEPEKKKKRKYYTKKKTKKNEPKKKKKKK